MASINTIVKGKNLDITPALRSYAEKKVAKFDKFLNDEQQVTAEVMMRTERGHHIAEITIDLSGLILRGVSKTGDMYASVDGAIERIERQFNKFKTKIQRKFQGPKLSELPNDLTTDSQDTVNGPRIVRTKRFAFKPMDVEEAVMQMELLGHDFFAFLNSGTEEVNVVYKRNDGNYGLIEPEL